MLEILEIYREEVEAVKTVPGILPAVAFQPLGVRSMEKMNERGGNAIGLDEDTPLTSKSHSRSLNQHVTSPFTDLDVSFFPL